MMPRKPDVLGILGVLARAPRRRPAVPDAARPEPAHLPGLPNPDVQQQPRGPRPMAIRRSPLGPLGTLAPSRAPAPTPRPAARRVATRLGSPPASRQPDRR